MNMFDKDTHPSCKRIVWIYILISTLYTEITCKRELRLLGLLSETGVSYKSAGSCLPAIDMALEDINRREDILKDYNLTYSWVDSQCHAGTALFRMFESLRDDRPYQMLLGPACSTAGIATAQVSYRWNLTQLSCETASPLLSDRTKFPLFFRTYMPDQKLNIARIAMFQEFNWKKVATVHQAREAFSAVTDDLVERIQGTNISIISQEIFSKDPYARAYNLKRHDARILVTVMYETTARRLLCAAYKVGLYGSKIVWIFCGWYAPTFWLNDLESIDCTKEQMALVVEGAFFTGMLTKTPFEERGIANITVSEFEHRYFNHPKYSPEWKSSDDCSALCYDHIWTAALALDCTVQVLSKSGHQKTLDQFTYEDGDIGKIIFDCMRNTSMLGVSGRTSFKEGSDTENVVEIERVQDGQRDKVGLYRQDRDPSYFEWIEGAIRWKGGIIPTDSAQIKNEEIKIPLPLYVVIVSLGALGICLSLSFLGFNVIYRNNRNVKLSSPNINNMLLCGCVLCYGTVFFKTTETENTSICRARIYCYSLGFTLMFGSLFSKTWRVYRIFINKNLDKVGILHDCGVLSGYIARVDCVKEYFHEYDRASGNASLYSQRERYNPSEHHGHQIKDSQLFIVNGILVTLILILLITWDIVESRMIKPKFLPKEAYVTTDGTEIRPFVRICWSEHSTYLTLALYIIQGALLGFGTFLAWETRNVHVKVLNDSKEIGISIYNVVILSVVGLTLSLLLEDQEVLLYGITSGFLVFGTTVTQMLIFVPKVRAIVNNEEVNHLSTTASSSASSTHQTSQTESFEMEAGSLQNSNEKQN